jgi:hypothetical protein
MKRATLLGAPSLARFCFLRLGWDSTDLEEIICFVELTFLFETVGHFHSTSTAVLSPLPVIQVFDPPTAK